MPHCDSRWTLNGQGCISLLNSAAHSRLLFGLQEIQNGKWHLFGIFFPYLSLGLGQIQPRWSLHTQKENYGSCF